MDEKDKIHPFAATMGLVGIIFSTGMMSIENGMVIIIAIGMFVLCSALYIYGENGLVRQKFFYVPVTLLGMHFLVSSGLKGEGLILYAFIAVIMSASIRSSYNV